MTASPDEQKRAAGEAAAGLVENGMVVGLGTGTTAVVETGTGIERLDLTDGSKSALQAPAASTDAAVLGRIAQLSDDTYLRVLGDVRSDGTIAAPSRAWASRWPCCSTGFFCALGRTVGSSRSTAVAPAAASAA